MSIFLCDALTVKAESGAENDHQNAEKTDITQAA